MVKFVNKISESSCRHYDFIESVVKNTRAYFDDTDEGYSIYCANYLNESIFDEEEKFILSVFNSDEISNQTFVYGAICLQPYQDTDSHLISGLLITDERIFVRLYATDDQEHDFEYYYYFEWSQLASAYGGHDDDGDDTVVLFDNEDDEVCCLHAELLGGRFDDMTISSLWIHFFNDAIREAKQGSVEDNHIYTEFMSNKLLFKPFVSWPDCVHLGLNKVDAISNKLLNEITLRRDEHLLWVSRHRANWKAKNDDEKLPSGCIITDQRICYFDLCDREKSFSVAWSEVAAIKHIVNSFYIQKSLNATRSDLKISDYALFDREVEKSSPVVVFLKGIVANKTQNAKITHDQSKRLSYEEERAVLKNEETKEKKEGRVAPSNVKHESVDASSDKNKSTQSLSSQNDIKKAYKNLQDLLQSTQEDVFDLNGVNSQFNTVKEKIAFAFDSKIKEAKKELDVALKDTVWDNLVIAFFGETNAGKSTIIETFRILFDDKRKKEDGLIVGDGRHDFTKTYEEYHLSIAGHPFTLIDVPGIEGNGWYEVCDRWQGAI